jgi:hypothetical protein
MMADESLSRLHYELIRTLIESGRCPSNAELASRLGTSLAELEAQLHALADMHGLASYSVYDNPTFKATEPNVGKYSVATHHLNGALVAFSD